MIVKKFITKSTLLFRNLDKLFNCFFRIFLYFINFGLKLCCKYFFLLSLLQQLLFSFFCFFKPFRHLSYVLHCFVFFNYCIFYLIFEVFVIVFQINILCLRYSKLWQKLNEFLQHFF